MKLHSAPTREPGCWKRAESGADKWTAESKVNGERPSVAAPGGSRYRAQGVLAPSREARFQKPGKQGGTAGFSKDLSL